MGDEKMLWFTARRKAAQAAQAAQAKQAALDELDRLLEPVNARQVEACVAFANWSGATGRRVTDLLSAAGHTEELQWRISAARYTAEAVANCAKFLSQGKALVISSRDGRRLVEDRLADLTELLQGWHALAEEDRPLVERALNLRLAEAVALLNELLDRYHTELMAEKQLAKAQLLRQSTHPDGSRGKLGAAKIEEPADWIDLVVAYLPEPTLANLNASPEETLVAAGLKAAAAIEHGNVALALELLARCNHSPTIHHHLGNVMFAKLNQVVETGRPWAEVTKAAAAIAVANQK
ncbi:MAG TPA: hypothetical protein VLI05_06205 [Candidatus Saccharimonadia bacterium]|nr:hypothetical protein [Candidatus Saccharimonadia bacterium]